VVGERNSGTGQARLFVRREIIKGWAGTDRTWIGPAPELFCTHCTDSSAGAPPMSPVPKYMKSETIPDFFPFSAMRLRHVGLAQ
jgi:hypothetical protein